MKLQSAIEFLTTYGFVLIVIAGLIAVIFLVIGSGRNEIPSSCTSFGGLDCNFLSFYSNFSDRYSLIEVSLSNAGSVPVYIGNFTAEYKGGSASGMCTPSFAYPGQTVICVAQLTGSTRAGVMINGYYAVDARLCNENINAINETDCTETATYRGAFFSQTTEQFSQPWGTVVASVSPNSLQFSNYNSITPVLVPLNYTTIQNGDFVTYGKVGTAAYAFGTGNYAGNVYLSTTVTGFPDTLDMLNGVPSCSSPYNSLFSFSYTTLYVPANDTSLEIYTSGPAEVFYKKYGASGWTSTFSGSAWKLQSAATEYSTAPNMNMGVYSIAVAWTSTCGGSLQVFNLS